MAETDKPIKKGKLTVQIGQNNEQLNQKIKNSKCPFTKFQILAIVVPISIVLLFAAIFIPVYVVKNLNKDNCDDKIVELAQYDEFEENNVNLTYAVLTPKNGYNNIFIFLGGIGEFSFKYIDFFKSNSTFVPKGTKIYLLSGQLRQMQFVIEKYRISVPVPGWFNIDTNANLIPKNDFTEAKKSLNLVLDEIDRIKTEDNIDYKNIYLGGFSLGGIMTNYILLNSRHELGGYLPFSGYVFDHDFSSNELITNLSDVQKAKLEARKNYHILAAHSFADDTVFYSLSTETYEVYFRNYTDFRLLSFGNIPHEFEEQPTHDFVRNWLKKSMGK